MNNEKLNIDDYLPGPTRVTIRSEDGDLPALLIGAFGYEQDYQPGLQSMDQLYSQLHILCREKRLASLQGMEGRICLAYPSDDNQVIQVDFIRFEGGLPGSIDVAAEEDSLVVSYNRRPDYTSRHVFIRDRVPVLDGEQRDMNPVIRSIALFRGYKGNPGIEELLQSYGLIK